MEGLAENRTVVQTGGRDEDGLEPATLKVITSGRTTGLPHIAIIRFAFDGASYCVMGGSRRTDWFLNALASKAAKVRLGERIQPVACEEFADIGSVRRLYAKKYGARIVQDWYSAPATVCLKMTPTGPLVLRGAIRGEGEVKVDFQAWKAQRLDYLTAVADAFDSASEEYDFTISGNFINLWTRERSIREVLSRARRDDVLLEIGCGTGMEAIRISKSVGGVVATDVSPKMVGLLRRKVEARKLSGKVRPLEMRAADVGRAAPYLPGGKARVVYSFNGALNCELEIARFPLELWKVMEPGGFFVCSIRNRFCLEESLYRAALLRFGEATPRKRQPKMVSVGGMDIPSYYYYPGEFARMFRPYFRVRKIVALPGILPPPYLNDVYVKLRRVLSFAEKADTALADKFPINRFGDQTLFVLQSEGAAPTEGARAA